MARTVQTPISAYVPMARKRRLDRIVEATSRRMTISKLTDEAIEMMLPMLEEKYLGKRGPDQNATNDPATELPG